MNTRRLVHVIIAIAIAALLTTAWVVATQSRAAAWVLVAELFAIVVAALLLNADLRPAQKHRVK